ncbi:S41 family peptidase [Candidatus Wolfebacteria bacterium]|nr:S41 family peptidase [Candidatus Wolfebacteria bacterium]
MNKLKAVFKNKYFQLVVIVLISAFLLYGVYSIGYENGVKNPRITLIRGVYNLEENKEEAVDFGIFWEAWKLIKDTYVDANKASNQDLVYGAISGMFGAYKDPNTDFFPPSEAKKFGEEISGEFSGIGAELGMKNEELIVIAPLKDSPAEKAGIKSGDKILKIDGTFTVRMSVDEAVKLIRGPKDTTVKLLILHSDEERPEEISIKRDTIQVPTIDFEMKDGDIAYIHLYNFYEKSPFLFYQTAIKAAMKNPKGIILDLRDDPGGYLDAAIKIAGWFLKPGEIVVREEFRSKQGDSFSSSGPGLFKDLPVVLLLNQGSASASEIVAGALRDNRKIKIVGKKSFRKGTVQEVIPLSNGSLAKITVAHWLMPGGKLIDKNGIDPDYDVDLSGNDIKNKKDPQLDKAMEILKSEISK